MKKTVYKQTYVCPIDLTLKLITGKWKSRILWFIHSNKIVRYSDIRRNLPQISEKMLTTQLKQLELDGILDRKAYPQIPPKVEYSISQYGLNVMPILELMYDFGLKHLEHYNITYKQKGVCIIPELLPNEFDK